MSKFCVLKCFVSNINNLFLDILIFLDKHYGFQLILDQRTEPEPKANYSPFWSIYRYKIFRGEPIRYQEKPTQYINEYLQILR